MTAEVAVLNREAIAIAADSAATFSSPNGHKIFSSANKIFTLSKYHPVGIMVYGNAAFMAMPWETIIKTYRRNLKKRNYGKLEEYGMSFLRFLRSNAAGCPKDQQKLQTHSTVIGYFLLLRREIERRIQEAVKQSKTITEEQAYQIVSKVISEHYKEWMAAPYGIGCGPRDRQAIQRAYQDVLRKAHADVFEKLPFSKQDAARLTQIGTLIHLKNSAQYRNPARSGVVLAGFGEKEAFPQCISYTVNNATLGRLNYVKEGHVSTSYKMSAVIAPFAQDDVPRTFLTGIAPALEFALIQDVQKILREYPQFIIENINMLSNKQKASMKAVLNKLSDEKFKSALENLRRYKQEKHISPIIKVVAMLPKDSLAEMAEALVNLTSFRRKVSMGAETVGGPIDVAVISKGDGFVWIKRKHYFKPELNHHFFANYYRSAA